jgi:hypothetical protein
MAKKKTNDNLVFIVPDIHFPEHDEQALAVTKRAIAHLKPGRTVILGDMLDAAPFSSHAPKSLKEVREYNFIEEEIVPGDSFLSFVEANTTNGTAFIEGNHEYRAVRWAIDSGRGAQAIYDAISPQVQLTKNRLDSFKYIPYLSSKDPGFSYYEICENLVAVHGWSTAKTCARIHLDKAHSRSVVFGHCHRQVSEAKRDPFTGERLVSWSPGCLRTLQPDYLSSSPSDWVLGFGLVYVSRTNPRDWTEYSLTIQNGRVILPDGTEINGD